MQYLIFIILLLSTTIASFWEGHKQGTESAIAHQTAIEDTLNTKFTEQQNAITRSIEGIRATNTTIVRKVETRIKDNPVYIDCKHDSIVLRSINAALTNTNEPADPAKSVKTSLPGTNPAK